MLARNKSLFWSLTNLPNFISQIGYGRKEVELYVCVVFFVQVLLVLLFLNRVIEIAWCLCGKNERLYSAQLNTLF